MHRADAHPESRPARPFAGGLGSDPDSGARRVLIFARVFTWAVTAVMMLLIARVVQLQVRPDAPLAAKLGMQRSQRPQPARRGGILDARRRHLAVSQTAVRLFADPELIEDPPAFAQELADALGYDLSLLRAARHGAGGPPHAELLEQGVEALAILGPVYGVGRRSQDRRASPLEGDGEGERSLPPKLHDQTEGLLALDDGEHIFQGEGRIFHSIMKQGSRHHLDVPGKAQFRSQDERYCNGMRNEGLTGVSALSLMACASQMVCVAQ